MAKVFPTSKAVNDALRVLAEAGRRHGKVKGSTRGALNSIALLCLLDRRWPPAILWNYQGVPKGVPNPKSQHA